MPARQPLRRGLGRICSLLGLFLTALTPTSPLASVAPILRISSGGAGERFGYLTSSAGDFNHDGFGDLIVSKTSARDGRVYLYWGGEVPDSTPDGVLSYFSPVGVYSFGMSISGGGDMNGDGYSDIVIGAMYHEVIGRAYVYLGGTAVTPHPNLILGMPFSSYLLSRFGESVSLTHDFNGDGFADVVVGSPGYYDVSNFAGRRTGRAYVYSGGPVPEASANLVLEAQAPPEFSSWPWGTEFGRTVSSAGDVDADGFTDLVVYQMRVPSDVNGDAYGRAFVFRGGRTMTSIPDYSLRGTPFGPFGFEGLVTAAGDYDGDGYDDIAVAAPYVEQRNRSVNYRPGLVFLYSGMRVAHGDSMPCYSLGAEDDFYAMVGGKDVNGDGHSDLVLGAPRANWDGRMRGRAYVFYGGVGADSIPDVILDGENDGGQFGHSVTLQDMNGDGVAEVIVGAPGPFIPEAPPGKVYIYDLSTPLRARAFVRGSNRVFPMAEASNPVTVRFEPEAGSFENSAVDRSTIRLVSEAPYEGSVAAIPDKQIAETDTDGNGVAELTARFPAAQIAELFRGVTGRREVSLFLTGRTMAHRSFRASVSLTLLGLPSRDDKTSVRPDPLKPSGTIAYTTSRAGSSTVRIYDLSGRLIRTLEATQVSPGSHSVRFDGFDDRGVRIASGVYFYHAATPDGTRRGKLVLAR